MAYRRSSSGYARRNAGGFRGRSAGSRAGGARSGGRRRTATRRTGRSTASPRTVKVVVELANQSTVSRQNEYVLKKQNPAPRKAKY